MDTPSRYANVLFLIALMIVASLAPYGLLTPAASADTTQEDWEQALKAKQSAVRNSAFGTTYSDEFIRLSLAERPEDSQQTVAFGPSGEPVSWTTAYLGPEMISAAGAGELTAQQIQDLDAIRAQAHLIVGTLDGPNGQVDVIALYHSATDENGTQYHHLVPIGEASPTLVNQLNEMVAVVQSGPIVTSKSPCDSPTHCHDLYRQRIADALNEFKDCMADQVPPLSLCGAACFVLCAPFLAGTPLAYAACVAACLAGCSAIDVIDYATCENALEAAVENAESSYCLCIAWKEANCQPSDWEVDIVDCGP